MELNLRDHIEKLNLFVAIAKAGSFRAAAARIHLSQPSLTYAMQVLEGALGVVLFQRSKQGVQLTLAGQELLKFSERLLIEVEGVEQRIKNPGKDLAGVLNVGTFTSFMTYLWPAFLKKFAADQPGVKVQLSTLKATEATSALNSRKHHMIVSTEFIHLQEAINIKLYKDEYGFFYSRNNKHLAKDLPLIYVPEATDAEGRSLEQIFWQIGLKNERTYQLDTFDAVKALATAGLGIAVLPLKLAAGIKDTHLVRVNEKSMYGKSYGEHFIYCSILSIDHSDPRIAYFIKLLKKWCLNF